MTTGGDIALAGSLPRAEALSRVAAYLSAQGVEEAAADARALLFFAASLTATDFVLSPQAPLGAGAAERLRAFALRRGAREPVSRIIGTRGFWTLDLTVAPQVLDPRADTETIVELALDLLRARRGEALSSLDLGAGSGAIACALLAELPRAFAVAVDVSAAACAAAAANLARCGLSTRGFVLRGRWAEAIKARFDLVVSNPPYIPSGDIPGLAPEVMRHDPALALDGGVDGLDCYRHIIAALPRLLAPRGVAVLEAGAGQAEDISMLLKSHGLTLLGRRRDAGGHERAVAAGA